MKPLEKVITAIISVVIILCQDEDDAKSEISPLNHR